MRRPAQLANLNPDPYPDPNPNPDPNHHPNPNPNPNQVRGHWSHRRKGPADLLQIRAVKEVVRCPVLTNGNVSSPEDLLASLALTGADGVMSAEGALDDPAIFGR